MGSEPDPNIARTLARHAQRRRQGLATLSVLVGAGPAGRSIWTGHAGPSLDTDPAAAMTASTLASACVAASCRQCPLLAAAVAEVGRWLGRPATWALAGRTELDLEQAWRTLDDAADRDLLQLLRTVCTRPVEAWAAEVTAALPGWRGVVAIDRLLADAPSIWLDEPPATPAWLATVAGPLAALASALPRWAIGIGTSRDSFAAFRATAGTGREATLLCGGAIEILGTPPAPAAEPLGSDPDDETDDDPARSAAERFLFDLLNERWPGLFALNVALPFPFGSRPAEADLYADAVRLVIEIDGYHHFQDPVCYRRDRRKDWAYQANGCRVVRVLAEDVVPRAGEILDQIAAAVEHCRLGGVTGGQWGQRK